MRPESSRLTARRVDLLHQIGRHGSILKAAKAARMSYKGAWDAVAAMNNLSERPLVETATGGKGGGGTSLTGHGRRMVEIFRELEQRQRRFLRGLSGGAGFDRYLGLLGRMAIRTSARNLFFGRVVRLRRSTVNAEIVLALKGQGRITATVTRESLEDLALREGSEAFALVKASWVILAPGEDQFVVSARNRFRGIITRLTLGPVNAEVAMKLPGDNTLIAVVTKESAHRLGLRVGEPVWAFFKASSVILGTQR